MKEDDIESLLVQQIEFCNTLIINKVDLVNEEQLKKIRAASRKEENQRRYKQNKPRFFHPSHPFSIVPQKE